MSFSSLLIFTCTIQHNRQTVKGDYNVEKSPQWVDEKEPTRCRFIPQVSNVRGMGGIVGEGSPLPERDFVKRVQQFLFASDTDITEADQIINVCDQQGAIVEAGPFNVLLRRDVHGQSHGHVGVITERTVAST